MPSDDLQIPPPPFVPISLAALAATAGVDADSVRELYHAAKERIRAPSNPIIFDPDKPYLWN
jgi:hypothetical protein